MRVFATLFDAVYWADSRVHRTPIVGPIRDRILDTILGPPDDFEYVSTTAPSGPPPSIP